MLFILLIYFILIKAPTKLNGIFLPEQNQVLTAAPLYLTLLNNFEN